MSPKQTNRAQRHAMQLRPYQEKCVGQVFESWIDYRKVLAVLPTGGGKTIVFANIARRADGRTLILAHREELLTQAIDKIKLATGIDASLERAESRSNPSSKIVVGSIQSMMRRLDKFQPTDFSNVIVDEAHHVAADSYMSVLGHFPEANILGVTATPDRSDKKQLGNYFEHVACEISLMDLIKDGYLSPIKVRVCDVSIDLSRVSFSVGDFDANDTADALEPYLERVAQQIKEYGGKKTLIFLPLISTSEMMARICKSLGLNARHVDGASEDRSSIIKWFKEQDRAVLCNAMLLTEGYDEPSIDTIVCLRPTRSRALYTQMIGRGTRLHPGKTYLTILDFLWMTGRHKLVRPTRLVTQDEVGDIADQMISNQGEFDLQDVARNAVEERERSLARELAKKKKNRGQLIDPIEFAISIHDTDIADFEPTMPWHSDPVTPAQREILKDFDMSDITCKGQASAIINRMFQRRDMGLASVKQVQLMRRLGVKNPEKIRFKDAGAIIGRMIPKR